MNIYCKTCKRLIQTGWDFEKLVPAELDKSTTYCNKCYGGKNNGKEKI
jgi:hypothetical protein